VPNPQTVGLTRRVPVKMGALSSRRHSGSFVP